MRKKIFFLLLLFPLMAYSQYYVGRDKPYKSSTFNSPRYFIESEINADGSVYLYYRDGVPLTLKKFTITGEADVSFGNNGVINNIPLNAGSWSISINTQNIYLSSGNQIAKYDLNGNPDTSFGINGIITLGQEVSNLSANSDSSLFYISNQQMKKLLPNGQIDNLFSIMTYQNKYYIAGNNIYTVTYTYQPSTVNFKKYDFNGVQDMTYGNNGVLTMNSGNFVFEKTSGDLYLQTTTGITKYKSTGILDNTFGVGGIVLNDFPTDILQVARDSNNNLVFFGGYQTYQYNRTIIFRLKENGDLDNTFHNGSYKFVTYEAPIEKVRLIDDNTYVCMDRKRVTSNSTNVRNNKYRRTLNPSEVLGIKEAEVKITDNLQIYPNPATDFITINIRNKDKISKVNVFAITGELVLSGTETKIDVRNLAAGNYMIEVTTENNKYTSKFIKK